MDVHPLCGTRFQNNLFKATIGPFNGCCMKNTTAFLSKLFTKIIENVAVQFGRPQNPRYGSDVVGSSLVCPSHQMHTHSIENARV